MKSKVLGICGGRGKMAKWFMDHFESAFKKILSYDLDSHCSLKEFVAQSDLILVSVPISSTVRFLEELAPFCRQDQFVMDFTSLKEAPCEALKKLPCPTLGLHPLFGPKAEKEDLRIVLCKTEDNPWIPKIENLLSAHSLQILKMDPKEHDQKMAYVQALNHGLHLILGEVLVEQNAHRLKTLLTPSLSLFIKGVQNITQNNGRLYKELAFYNPYFLEALLFFKESLNQYIEIIQNKDDNAFELLFNRLKEKFNA